MLNIHGTLVSLDNKGILLVGKSGSGKSDLALRLIMEHSAKLVSDDRVDVALINGELYGFAPSAIEGKLEIRGVGIASFDYKKQEKLSLCVELCTNRHEIERLPLYTENETFLGVSVTKIKLYPFDCSTICKIIAKLNNLTETPV